jgi:sugar phosphate isomerase/epimerase
MKIGVFTDSTLNLSLADSLDRYQQWGITAVELGAGNFSPAPHLNLDKMLGDAGARKALLADVKSHGMVISALNCSGNPIHPRDEVATHDSGVIRDTIRLASELGIDRIVTMSGCPGEPGGSRPNWITFTWPPDFEELLHWQWNERILPYWTETAAYARSLGVTLCFEMHPGMSVYNTASLLRLRGAISDTITANLDPSHLWWQGMDPLEVVRVLGPAVGFVHAKDTRIDPHNTGINGCLDTTLPALPARMSWVFRAVGYGHGAAWWRDFISLLQTHGYDGVLSIEHEDPLMGLEDGTRMAAEFLKPLVFSPPAAGEGYTHPA